MTRTQIGKRGNARRSKLTASSAALYGFRAIAAFYLITERRAHTLGWLPWLLILSCPVLHIFMHRKHGAHGHNHHERRADQDSRWPPMDQLQVARAKHDQRHFELRHARSETRYSLRGSSLHGYERTRGEGDRRGYRTAWTRTVARAVGFGIS